MSLEVYFAKKNRVYRRKFDHEEALARFQAGESVRALAGEYGVDENAVRRVVIPGEKDAQMARARRWRTGTCERCGGPAMRLVSGKLEHNPDGLQLCSRCRGYLRRERVRFNKHGELVSVRCCMLDCANGRRWQPPENFTRGHEFADIREGGIHTQCRSCQTRARRRYRERRKTPCHRCGEPRLGDEMRRVQDTGLCLSCYRARGSAK